MKFSLAVGVAFAASLAAAECQIDLVGGERLRRDFPEQFGHVLAAVEATLAESSRARVRANLIELLSPPRLFAALATSGLGEDAGRLVLARFNEVGHTLDPERTPVLARTFTVLRQAEGERPSLCVMEAGCPEFELRGLRRPFVAVNVLGPVDVRPVRAAAVPAAPRPPFHFSAAFVRLPRDAEFFVVDALAGLASAAYGTRLRAWALGGAGSAGLRRQPLFTAFARLTERGVILDDAFVEFMTVMASFEAILEYERLVPPGRLSPTNLRQPGRPSTVEAAWRALSQDTRVAMAARGVLVTNARERFRDWDQRVGDSI